MPLKGARKNCANMARLSLSNNQLLHIPYRFAECAHLRYLNIRANNFREFPKGVRSSLSQYRINFAATNGSLIDIQVAFARDSGS